MAPIRNSIKHRYRRRLAMVKEFLRRSRELGVRVEEEGKLGSLILVLFDLRRGWRS